jgi:long-subunit acyl-CoA synthetase (AMP-forming)
VSGSLGYLIPGLQAKLIDDEGNSVSAYNVLGEFCVRGGTVFPGYYKNPVANAASFDSEGFYKTGDIMYSDEKTQK